MLNGVQYGLTQINGLSNQDGVDMDLQINDVSKVVSSYPDGQQVSSCKRGAESASEINNVTSEAVDNFVYKTDSEIEALSGYFHEKILEFKNDLPIEINKRVIKRLAHVVFAVYRQEQVRNACEQVEKNPASWGYTIQGWQRQKPAFQDYVWMYFKMLGVPRTAIENALKKEFPNFDINNLKLYLGVFSDDREQYYQPSKIYFHEWTFISQSSDNS